MRLKTSRSWKRRGKDERMRKRRDNGFVSSGNDVDGDGGGGEKTSLRSLTGEKMVGAETSPETKRIALDTVVAAMGGCEPIG